MNPEPLFLILNFSEGFISASKLPALKCLDTFVLIPPSSTKFGTLNPLDLIKSVNPSANPPTFALIAPKEVTPFVFFAKPCADILSFSLPIPPNADRGSKSNPILFSAGNFDLYS